MSSQLRLPPSKRDFEIFFAVAFHSVSTRRAAEFHRISQTRVRQLVALVAGWVADNLPDWGEADLKKQVRLAQHVAANRLEHQYEQAMSYWNAEGQAWRETVMGLFYERGYEAAWDHLLAWAFHPARRQTRRGRPTPGLRGRAGRNDSLSSVPQSRLADWQRPDGGSSAKPPPRVSKDV